MIKKITYLLGRNDEEPNIKLALDLIKKRNFEGIHEITEGLHNEIEQIANNCIKVLSLDLGRNDSAFKNSFLETKRNI